jgi:hypothetical protein
MSNIPAVRTPRRLRGVHYEYNIDPYPVIILEFKKVNMIIDGNMGERRVSGALVIDEEGRMFDCPLCELQFKGTE